MFKKYTLILYILPLLIAFNGCAWENLPEGEVANEKIIRVNMRMEGPMHEELYYYIVFNLSGDPERKPYSLFMGEDRGKYWSVYYMYGQPPFRDRDIYRGFGGTTTEGANRVDGRPTESRDLNEILSSNTQGDQFTLELNLTEFGLIPDLININMIVCNQAIDLESKLEYEWDPYVYDSFWERGISINMNSNDLWWGEANPDFQMEQDTQSNEHELSAPPEADIISWYFQVVSK